MAICFLKKPVSLKEMAISFKETVAEIPENHFTYI